MAFRLTRSGELMSHEGKLSEICQKNSQEFIGLYCDEKTYTQTIPAQPFMILTETFKDKIIHEIINQIMR